MSDQAGTFPWTEEQWTRARKVVQDSARRARVASSFLPLYGPLPPDQVTVNSMHLKEVGHNEDLHDPYQAEKRLEVDDSTTIALTTISADIFLRTYEAADPEMTAALSLIGRAADVLGRLEDSIIFNGQIAKDQGPNDIVVRPPVYRIKGGQERPGLLTAAGKTFDVNGTSLEDQGARLVDQTVEAISFLEGNGHYGPFAQVLGNELYQAANSPSPHSMVLPSDRIRPFLDGPLLRSSTMPADAGVVVALAGEPIDLVIAHDLELKLVQMTLEPRYVLRISERFTLRVKQEGAVVRLHASAASSSESASSSRRAGKRSSE